MQYTVTRRRKKIDQSFVFTTVLYAVVNVAADGDAAEADEAEADDAAAHFQMVGKLTNANPTVVKANESHILDKDCCRCCCCCWR